MKSILSPPQDAASPWLPELVTIQSIQAETPGVVTYALAFADQRTRDGYSFRPGQFNMLYLPGIGEAAISISSDSEEPGLLLHTVRAAGNVTGALSRKRPGDRIGLRGPFGSSWPVDRLRGQEVVIACGG